MPLFQYIIIALVLLGVFMLYLRLARRLNIIDRPGERSSHNRPTVRGGGVIFPVAALIWFFLVGWESPWAIAGLLLIALVSFIDDLRPLPEGIRLVVHLLAVVLLFYQLGLHHMHWYWIAGALILAIGCINAFNFMDGINGITAGYALVSLGTFSLLNNAGRLLGPVFPQVLGSEFFLPPSLVGTVFVAVLVFAFFNARPRALAFAGDVGSISLAFLLSWMLIELMVLTHQAYWLLLFAVYGIDTSVTILVRLSQRKNIFKPHRQHLYQLLANEHGWPHLKVAALYGGFQLVINLLTIWLVFTGRMNWVVFVLMGFCLTAIYWLIRRRVVATVPGRSH